MNYKIGLDIGIASVGYSIINQDENKIEKLGSRVFESAEVPKTGESLSAKRREVRGKRRTGRRRKYKVLKVKKLILALGLNTESGLNNLYNSKNMYENLSSTGILNPTLWNLRVYALDNLITTNQLQILMLYFVKHRGFLSNRKSEMTEKDLDNSAILKNIDDNKLIMEENNYRSVAEMMVKNNKFNIKEDFYIKPLRNRGVKNYTNSINRGMLLSEINLIFESQRSLGNKDVSEELQEQYIKIFNMQRPVASGTEIIEKLGKCSLEITELKAAKACYTSEKFVALTKLLNLRTTKNKKLTPTQIKEILEEAKNVKSIKLSKIRKIMSLDDLTALEENERFNIRYEDYQKGKPVENATKKAEDKEFISLNCYHQIKSKIKTELDAETLDIIGNILTFYKTDNDIKEQFEILLPSLDTNIVENLLFLSFAKPVNLSLKAMKKLIPHMENGLRYDEARKIEYPNSFTKDSTKLKKYLPKIKYSDVRNPVVYRSLCQTRQVLNLIITKYGSPTHIHIETARDLNKSFEERKKLSDLQVANKEKNERAIKKLKDQYNIDNPTGLDITKMKLYEQQGEKCMYSGQRITIDQLFTTLTEIDHIKPFSKTCDNSQNNKVLVLTSENQMKLNNLPYEYMNETQWHEFKTRVEASTLPYKKKQNLLKLELTEADLSGFKDNDLNNTRYISKYISTFIKDNLQFNTKLDPMAKQHVSMPSGGVTAYLRTIYGFNKIRANGDTHHALDAAIIAVCDQSIIQKINKYSGTKEIYQKNKHTGNYVHKKTGEVLTPEEMRELITSFPEPWTGFRKELAIRMGETPAYDIINDKDFLIKEKYTDEELEKLKPIFVSRAKFEKTTGQMHLDTIGLLREINGKNYKIDKVPLSKLTLKNIEDMYDKNRNIKLYNALKYELEMKGKEAFKEPFFKPTNSGKKGPIVRSVKLQSTSESFFEFKTESDKTAIAGNGGMYRIDVFKHKTSKKYFIVPIYISDVYMGMLPNKACKPKVKKVDWPEMTEEYDFVASFSKNDLIKVVLKKEDKFGYYINTDVSTGSITIKNHDNTETFRGIGIFNAINIEKWQVDPLGEISKCEHEERKSQWVTNKLL